MPQPFPHLLPAEGVLWARFLQRYGAQWDTFEYDVRVGAGAPQDPTLLPIYQEMADQLALKRIDAVGWVGLQPTLFEINPRGGLKPLGAIQLYGFLWRQAFPQGPAPHLAVVLSRCDVDCQTFYQAHGIQLFLIPEPVLVP